MDVGMDKPMKNHIKHQFAEWLFANIWRKAKVTKCFLVDLEKVI
jgi:hypothetical protein